MLGELAPEGHEGVEGLGELFSGDAVGVYGDLGEQQRNMTTAHRDRRDAFPTGCLGTGWDRLVRQIDVVRAMSSVGHRPRRYARTRKRGSRYGSDSSKMSPALRVWSWCITSTTALPARVASSTQV